MTFKHLHIKHDRTAEEAAWIEEEISEQEVRFQKIDQEMAACGKLRKRWYEEFFDRITTRGFNVDGDDKLVIAREDLPAKPEGREDRVVWKDGVDSE